jgi:hypothetical protein
MTDESEFGRRMERLENLLGEVERGCAAESLELVRGLVRALLDVHQTGLREILEVIGGDPLRRLCERPSIASLLLLHDLHPNDLRERIAQAIAEANQAVGRHAQAALVAIHDQRVLVRIEAEAAGAADLLRRSLERSASAHAPDALLEIEPFESPARTTELIPATRLHRRTGGAAL